MPELTELQDLTAPQRSVLAALGHEPILADTFYLTGGTLLKARGISPRESNDLDFFTFPTIDGPTYTRRLVTLRQLLEQLFGSTRLATTDRGFLHVPSGTRIDAVADTIPAIDAFVAYNGLKTAGLKDVAASKASALCSRDELKDYLDVAFLTKHTGWRLKDLAGFAEEKFKLGTVSEEKLFTELLAKRAAFDVHPTIFLRGGERNVALVAEQVQHLLDTVSV